MKTLFPQSLFEVNHLQVIGRLDAATTLVFVHGFGTDQRSWLQVARAFEADCRIILYDQAGAGKSDPALFLQHRYLNLTQYAADLLAICSALDLKGAILVGHSMGAMVAALAAIRAPELFSRLVMIGASPRYLNDGEYQGGMSMDDLAEIYRLMTQDYDRWTEDFAHRVMLQPEHPAMAEEFASSLRGIPREHALTLLCSILQTDHREDLPKLRLPVLILQTLDDPFVPQAVAEYIHQQIAGSRIGVIETRGHFPQLAAPDQVAAAIRSFI